MSQVLIYYLGACDLYTWGCGERGMLGHKDEDDEMLPRVVESLLGRDIVMLACGVFHTMALSGELYMLCQLAFRRLSNKLYCGILNLTHMYMYIPVGMFIQNINF